MLDFHGYLLLKYSFGLKVEVSVASCGAFYNALCNFLEFFFSICCAGDIWMILDVSLSSVFLIYVVEIFLSVP